ncbi:hypothetical protein MTR67_047829 [Solanum verrucosum]|uniref:CCHC-type domain-containing protein n=1 Tax=Solanum verrucosum TaxID=315347 RepID=A0AAF0UZ80_SOLVR|nr:hypothetical protein MTR67_047829 [Solanum verrucosum]
MFFRQSSSNDSAPKFNKDKMSNPKSQGGGGNESSIPTCTRCGKKHNEKCMAGTNGCFGCGKSGHKVKDCLLQASTGKDGRQAQPSGFSLGAPKQNRLYALQTQ